MGGRGSGNPSGNPKNLKNGPPFPKGQSGNPTGRPHRFGTLFTNALREQLAAIFDVKTKQTYAQRLAKLLIDCALNPDPELDKTRIMALAEIVDRCEGKPKAQLEINDITAELRERPTEDLVYHLEHGYWPEEEYQRKRNAKLVEAAARLEAVKTDTDTTQ